MLLGGEDDTGWGDGSPFGEDCDAFGIGETTIVMLRMTAVKNWRNCPLARSFAATEYKKSQKQTRTRRLLQRTPRAPEALPTATPDGASSLVPPPGAASVTASATQSEDTPAPEVSPVHFAFPHTTCTISTNRVPLTSHMTVLQLLLRER